MDDVTDEEALAELERRISIIYQRTGVEKLRKLEAENRQLKRHLEVQSKLLTLYKNLLGPIQEQK